MSFIENCGFNCDCFSSYGFLFSLFNDIVCDKKEKGSNMQNICFLHNENIYDCIKEPHEI